jgi:hypothetical protein
MVDRDLAGVDYLQLLGHLVSGKPTAISPGVERVFRPLAVELADLKEFALGALLTLRCAKTVREPSCRSREK